MNFEELEHIVRAAKDLTAETEFIAIGSQSLPILRILLALLPRALEDACRSKDNIESRPPLEHSISRG